MRTMLLYCIVVDDVVCCCCCCCHSSFHSYSSSLFASFYLTLVLYKKSRHSTSHLILKLVSLSREREKNCFLILPFLLSFGIWTSSCNQSWKTNQFKCICINLKDNTTHIQQTHTLNKNTIAIYYFLYVKM